MLRFAYKTWIVSSYAKLMRDQLKLTATVAGSCTWITHFASFLAICIAECMTKPELLMPQFVLPGSRVFPSLSIFTKLDAVISW